jgi:hypothetical protein
MFPSFGGSHGLPLRVRRSPARSLMRHGEKRHVDRPSPQATCELSHTSNTKASGCLYDKAGVTLRRVGEPTHDWIS